MARRYTVDGSDTNTDATTILYVAANSSTPFAIYHIILGSRAAPADNAASYTFQRFSAENGTPGGTAKTPQAIDPRTVAAVSNAVDAPTGEPTYTANANLLPISKNMRATVQWIANPGSELIAVTTDNGIGCKAVSPSTAYIEQCTIMFEE